MSIANLALPPKLKTLLCSAQSQFHTLVKISRFAVILISYPQTLTPELPISLEQKSEQKIDANLLSGIL